MDIRDHGGVFGGNSFAQNLPIYYQQTAPVTTKVGALWVKRSGAPAGTVYYSDTVTPSGVTIANGDMLILLENAGAVADVGYKRKLIFRNESGNPWNFIKDFTAKVPSFCYHRENGKWVSQDLYCWSGSAWTMVGLGNGYLYKDGVNPVFENGISINSQSPAPIYDTNHIRIRSKNSDLSSQVSVTSRIPIDLTDVETLNIDWETNHGVYSGATLVVNSVKNVIASSVQSNQKLETVSQQFNRRTDVLNVSALNGLYYISVHAVDFSDFSSNVAEADVKVYNIWMS